MPASQRVVFIVSTGRTGTVSIARALAGLAPEISARHEPWLSRPLRILGNAYASGNVTERAVRLALRATVDRRVQSAHGQVYVEVSPYLRTLISPLAEMYPGACFAHIVRDPADYILSYAGHGAFDGTKGWIGRWLPYWLLKPEHLESTPDRRWQELSPAAALAWRWTALNGMIEAHADVLGARYRRFRFEDLFGSSSGLEPLVRWIAPAVASGRELPTVVRANARGRTATASRLQSEGIDLETVEEICGPLAACYGYCYSH